MPTTTAKSRSDLHRESLRKTLQSLAEADDKTKALLGLDQFIKDKPPQDLHFKALEIRCSINISLGNLAVATKDGKEICRLQPQSCKGYIRLAKILSKQGEVDKVTRIYDHALTVLSRGSKDYDTVAGLREKWVVMLARRRKKCDMFEFLPAEILDEILSYMRFRDIVRFLGVSRSWHNYIEARPHFWRYIDLRDIKRPLGLKPLIACLKKSRESIQELRLGPLQDAAYDKVVRLIGQVGRQAKVLEFKDLKRTLPVPKEFSASTGLLSCLKELYLSRTTAWDIAVILSKVRTLEVLEVLDVMQSDSIDWNCCVAQLKRLRVGKMERFSGRALELDEWAEVWALILPKLA
ncbi:hypothetical protein BJ508DRAFT_168056 [Ascobolus immersus RN42]|uniref:F-box domain-containing protein n=1 Tax=Ascobolus immersus RN42 TaxID=1160509 RepID=A0A3N4INM9_ASCIM|nr:hypothetical protein BJ508DRAFT_168056 [Ascobolus immersus RN42]